MKKVLIIDNNDSFVYNIIEMLRPLCTPIVVDQRHCLQYSDFDKVVLSPGAGLPDEYPQMMQFLEQNATKCNILGVCLGHQAIAQHFGATLTQLDQPKHAHQSTLIDCDTPLLEGISTVGRYHSWVVERASLPEVLRITSTDENGEIMSLEHKQLPIFGVQFHPESIITPNGQSLFVRWMAE